MSVITPPFGDQVQSCTFCEFVDQSMALSLNFSFSSNRKNVLVEMSSIDDGIGTPNWKLVLFLILCWSLVMLIVIKGVHSSGKASYFLAIFPYVIILVLLIRASTLPGAIDGIIFFLNPQWDQILKPKVWYAAVTQVFFSLSVCFGNIVMYASYNKFSHNIRR
jgi:solute carrier family 6 (neurotransmitter transporter, glycine) member 5/9